MSPNAPRRRGCRYWFRLLSVGLIGGLLIAYFGYVILSAEAFMRPAHRPIGALAPSVACEDISLTTTDGLTLRGGYIPSHNHAAIILLHG